MKSGTLAKRCQCPVETVRYYEKIGLLPGADRAHNGYRVYTDVHVKWLLFILRCKALGFSQDQVRKLRHLADQTTPACHDVHQLLLQQLEEVRAKLVDLKQLERSLVNLEEKCLKDQLHICPVIDELMDGAT